MSKGISVGEHPPRLTAERREDPWSEEYVEHPERWIGAETAHRQKVAVNLKNAVEATLSGGAGRYTLAARINNPDAWVAEGARAGTVFAAGA